MSKQLFAVNGKGQRGLVFINPGHVVGIACRDLGITEIFCSDGESFTTNDLIRDVVDRYQTAINQADGYLSIVDIMKHYTHKKTEA